MGEREPRPAVVVVTGTDTGVGKTVTTAALAASARADGLRVLVVKPTQTGVGGPVPDVADVDEVARLAGVETRELVRLDEPLAPDTAARRQGVVLPTVAEHARRVVELADGYDVVLVEGAGGLLVRLDGDGGTLLDLVRALRTSSGVDVGLDVGVVVVARPGLGTLNHTALTVEVLRAAGVEPSGVVLGTWPRHPGTAERCNLDDLPRTTGVPVLGRLPEGASALDLDAFAREVASELPTSAWLPRVRP